jgi:hypothetical protein
MAGLRELRSSGRVAPAPMSAHTVTAAMRQGWAGNADDEELEYAALMAAAFDSLVLIAASGADPRRVVIAADVDDADVRLGSDETIVEVLVEVPLSRCSAVHVDDADAEGEVATALTHLPSAVAGDGLALATVALVAHELMWFATQEIPDILG